MDLLYGQAQQGGGLAAFLPFILIMFVIYFLMIRPQTKRQKQKELMRESLQKGDVVNTLSDNTNINEWIGAYPKTSLDEGIKKFINWYKDYYK